MDLHSSREELEAPLLSSEPPTMKEEGDNAKVDEVEHSDSDPLHPNPVQGPTENAGILMDATDDDSWYRNPHQITAMVSNFSTSYNVVNISLVLPILQELTKASSEDEAVCASSLLAGMIIGQLVGGALGDSFLGRLGALKLVMCLQIVASLASASLSVGSGDIYVKLALWRFILGVGAGGVYPLAAVLSAEQGKRSNSNSNSGDQVKRVVLTFSMQGLGFVTVPLVAVPLLHMTTNLNLIWRVLLGLGSVPGILLFVMQWRLYARAHRRGAAVLLEEPTDDVNHTDEAPVPTNGNEEGNIVIDADTPEVPTRRMGWWESIRHEPGLGGKIIGTAGTWFLFDILFYGNTLFQPIVVEAAFGSAKSESAIHLLQKTALDSLILTSIALPGYAVAGLLMGKRTFCVTQTPRYVMLQGFAAMSVLYFTIGSNWSYLRRYPVFLVTLYGMTFFFANYGPNTTTFILPSLLYSPECRSTWNGISAASGKLGALFGATLFAPAADKWGDDQVMIICSGVSVAALIITWCFVPKDGEDPRPPQQYDEGSPNEDELPTNPALESA
jgi:PHS family inorganic phosphate transporter-like MFS transporter